MTKQARFDPEIHCCPKCGCSLSDYLVGEPVSAVIGEWSEDRFRCERPIFYAGEKSCGYFRLEDLGFVHKED